MICLFAQMKGAVEVLGGDWPRVPRVPLPTPQAEWLGGKSCEDRDFSLFSSAWHLVCAQQRGDEQRNTPV